MCVAPPINILKPINESTIPTEKSIGVSSFSLSKVNRVTIQKIRAIKGINQYCVPKANAIPPNIIPLNP